MSRTAIVRLVRNPNSTSSIAETDRIAQVSHTAFDALTFEVWGALLNGATLVLVDKESLLSPTSAAAALRADCIDVMFLTTSLFHHIAAEDPAAFGSVRDLLVGGEVLDPGRARAVLRSASPPARLLNCYGPTENTTFSTWYDVARASDEAPSIPIGRPIANSMCYVLDGKQRLLPVGAEGELYVGGDGVGVGYWNRPELTTVAFVPDPFRDEPGARLYRTGDLARWLPDGTLQFVGRRDGQVKLRGFRIELREIEFALREHPAVHEAAVLLRTTGTEKVLVAYVRPKGDAPSPTDLRAHLAARVPAYMIPARWLISDQLPLTPSGKLDLRTLDQRDDLPATEAEAAPATGTASGRTPFERRLIQVWQELLETVAIGPHDDFFELGGHSMLAVRLGATVEREFGCRIPLAMLLQASKLERMAAVIEDAARTPSATPTSRHEPIVVSYNEHGSMPLLFCVAPYTGTPLAFRELAAALGPHQPVYELKPPELGSRGGESIDGTADELLAAARSVQPHGPYRLAGYCLGGAIAYEMACRLEECGESVESLVLLDSVNYGTRRSERARTASALGRSVGAMLDYASRVCANDAPLRMVRRTLQRRSRDLALRGAYELFRALRLPQPALVRKGLTVDALVAARHAPRSFPGRLVLFRSTDYRLDDFQRELGWAALPEGGIEIVETPGDHVSILHAPDAGFIAAKLTRLLRSPNAPARSRSVSVI